MFKYNTIDVIIRWSVSLNIKQRNILLTVFSHFGRLVRAVPGAFSVHLMQLGW